LDGLPKRLARSGAGKNEGTKHDERRSFHRHPSLGDYSLSEQQNPPRKRKSKLRIAGYLQS
jgi:hypothetical protein